MTTGLIVSLGQKLRKIWGFFNHHQTRGQSILHVQRSFEYDANPYLW